MKPPPRQRILPNRYEEGKHERKRRRQNVCTWGLVEQRGLLTALERLNRRRGSVEIDYADLQKRVPKRSIPQLRSMVRELQARAVSRGAHQLLRQRRAEEAEGGEEEPAQLWRDMAGFVAGDLEEAISTAFSQMLVVSSTEPRTLSNSADAPPRSGPTQPTKTAAVTPGHLPCKSISQGAPPPFLIFKTPAAMLTPVRGPSSSPVGAHVPPSTPAQGTSATSSLASPGAGCQATASAPKMLRLTQASSVAGAMAEPGTRVEPVEGTRDAGQREQRSKCSVDFQKIYLHLANARRESERCQLTSLECAVVLDLLMALAEELPLLDCSELRQHMIEAYTSLSAPAGSSDLGTERGGDPTPLAAENSPGATNAGPNRGAVNSAAAGERNVLDDRGARATRTPATASESTLCPLNPFMVPLKLLVKRN